jgi:gliding motility-associated lipoprotein GldJ
MSQKFCFLFLVGGLLFASCSKKSSDDGRSATTGWKYNDTEWGGFEKLDYEGQINAPNMVLVPGGTFTMGLTDQDVTFEWNNIPRRITVTSFYMDETEVSNISWREYVYWLSNKYETYPEVAQAAMPDEKVWLDELSANEPLVETYFRHPAYDQYPVVGVSWDQTQEYCKWRTDRVNEMIMIERGILNPTPDQKDSDVFTTDAYLAGQYEGNVRKNLPDIKTGGERPVKFEDGILVPSFRLPTEAEWEYAALGLQGNLTNPKDELISDRRYYPWDGKSPRYQKHNKDQGRMLANFKRGRGDYMGTAGNLNDNAAVTGPVRSYYPNDFGLYNMGGNVSEWVEDVYRPLTSVTLRDAENHDLNPFRGNVFTEKVKDEYGNYLEKDSLGRMRYREVTTEELAGRENYRTGDARNYRDGDDENVGYDSGKYTLISDKSRVIKGGSWADRLYWLSPGTRRFKDQDKADRTIGFRCAMTRVGGQNGNEDKGGISFKEKGKTVKRKYN